MANDGFGALDYLSRHDAVLDVVAYLLFAVTVGLVDGALHRAGDFVGIEYGAAVNVACCTANGLYECAVAAQETLFVGVEDGHEAHLGQVEAFAQQVDSDKDVVDSHSQVAHYLNAFEGVDIAVDIGCLDAEVDEVAAQLFGHTLGEGGDEHALAIVDGVLYLLEQVVDLCHGGPDFDDGVEQSCGAYDLFHNHAFGLCQLVVGGGGADVYCLAGEGVELFVAQGTVVERRREAEAVFDERGLAAAVAAVHRSYLGYGDVAFVNDKQEIVGEIVEQAEGTRAGLSAVKVAAIVLDAAAVAELLNHLDVVVDALFEAFGLEVLAYLVQVVAPLEHIVLYVE